MCVLSYTQTFFLEAATVGLCEMNVTNVEIKDRNTEITSQKFSWETSNKQTNKQQKQTKIEMDNVVIIFAFLA